MQLAGLQKMTLLDYPGEIACTVFTQGCDLRCPFCQNADLVLPDHFAEQEMITENVFFEFLERRKGRLTGVAVSGGEPLLQKDLPAFLEKIRRMDYKIKLDTNGTFPAALKELVQAGLVDYVAMDVKNSREKYAMTCGLSEDVSEKMFSDVSKSIAFLKEGHVSYEFRTTVAKGLHTVDEIEAMAKMLQGAEVWYLQQFLDSDHLICRQTGTGMQLKSPSRELMREMCAAAESYVGEVHVRGL